MKKIIVASLLLPAMFSSSASFAFDPTISLLGAITTTKDYNTLTEGAFNVRDRKFNLGIECTEKIYVSGNFFIKTGLRYNTYKTTVNNEHYDVAHFTWLRNYASIAVPVHVGMDFATKKGNEGDVFVGASLGMLTLTSATDDAGGVYGGGDDVMSTLTDNAPNNNTFFPTIDFGANYHLFPASPRFSVGLLCSIQMNRSDIASYQGTVQDQTTGAHYSYSMTQSHRFINCALSLNYTLGKQKHTAKNSVHCPAS